MKTSSTLLSSWPNPQRDHKPWTRWWWMGSAVDEENLTLELTTLRDAGFGGVEITPIYGVKGEEAREVPFLSDRWLELFLHACREADRLGLGVDIVPGSGWRLGGPDVPKGERAVKLKLIRKKSPTGPRLVATAALSHEPIKRPGPGGAGSSIDMFDKRAIANHLKRFEARFFKKIPAHFVRAQFHDSWEYEADWSHRFPQEFLKRRGYDLQYYASVFESGGGNLPRETVSRVLHDYRQTIDEMILDHFSDTWNTNCHARGILTRNQAHGSPGNLLDLYAKADIPETEIIWDGTNPLVQKFASSAGHVAGKPLISAESFTWLSNHWRSDLAKIKRYTDYLFLCGINHIVCHGNAYSPADAEWPGWLFYAATQLNSRNPIWRDWPALSAYITRCQSFLQAGKPDERVLLYWPLPDLSMNPEGRLPHYGIHSDFWGYGEPLRSSAQTLWDGGVPFDYVSDRQLQRGEFATPYQAIVLPPLHYLPLETAQALDRLASSGLRIISSSAPTTWDVPGLDSLAQRRRQLHRITKSLSSRKLFLHTGDVVAALAADPFGTERFQENTELRCIRRLLDNGNTLYFIVNRGDHAFRNWIKPTASGTHAILRDAWTGEVGTARLTARGLKLHLESQQSVFVEITPTEPTGSRWSGVTLSQGNPEPLTKPWTVSFIAGGPSLPKPLVRKTLASITEFGDPELQRFGGTIRYETTFDRPASADKGVWLDLGEVRHSARVFMNDRELGVLIQKPYRIAVPTDLLRTKRNKLVVEVTTLAINRIRDLDCRGVMWKKFQDINFVDDLYRPFDASSWPIEPAGLLGPVGLSIRS